MADDEAQEAIREAYQAYYRRLVATLYGLTADYAEAQDLVQEAYARALARPKAFLDVADPEAWLRTVAVNLARTRWRRRRLLDTMIRTGRVTPTPESVPGADPTRVLLVAALAKLSRPTRETIVLHHIADMSVQEVAEQLGVPVGTVKARLSRGRALLAELLQEAAPTAAVPSPQPASRRGPGVRLGGAGILPAYRANATADRPVNTAASGTGTTQAAAGTNAIAAAGTGEASVDARAGAWRPMSADLDNADLDNAVPHPRTEVEPVGDGVDQLLDQRAQPGDRLVSARGRRR